MGRDDPSYPYAGLTIAEMEETVAKQMQDGCDEKKAWEERHLSLHGDQRVTSNIYFNAFLDEYMVERRDSPLTIISTSSSVPTKKEIQEQMDCGMT